MSTCWLFIKGDQENYLFNLYHELKLRMNFKQGKEAEVSSFILSCKSYIHKSGIVRIFNNAKNARVSFILLCKSLSTNQTLQVHTNHKEKNFSALCMCQCSNAAVNKMLNMQDHWSHKKVLAASFLASIPAVSISSSKGNPEMFISWGKQGRSFMWKHDISSSVYREQWLICNANCILLVL